MEASLDTANLPGAERSGRDKARGAFVTTRWATCLRTVCNFAVKSVLTMVVDVRGSGSDTRAKEGELG